ncbi:hypothetical protein GW17_00025052 [Ensete ventricosum]|nr:hypothetical protein GW17_00025052 [Ensete ventricosum]
MTRSPVWPTRHSEADLTQAWRSQRLYDRPDMGKADTPQLQQVKRTPHPKDHGQRGEVRQHDSRPEFRHIRSRPAELDPGAPSTQLCSTSSPSGTTAGVLAHTVRTSDAYSTDTEAQTAPIGQARRFSTNILALEGGPMLQERPSGNSNVKHHMELNHPPQAEEVTTSGPTPNRFWRIMTNPGFPPLVSNPVPFVVTAESVTPQSAPLATSPQMESSVAPNREIQLETEVLQRRAAKVHADSPVAALARSRSRSRDPVQASPDLDTLLSDSADSLREQVRQVHQRLDVVQVQKEVLKSKGEVEESSKGGSPFTPEIQDKQLPANFRLLALELYDGSYDPAEDIATFHAQMALY